VPTLTIYHKAREIGDTQSKIQIETQKIDSTSVFRDCLGEQIRIKILIFGLFLHSQWRQIRPADEWH
jgi:hypothetical protein